MITGRPKAKSSEDGDVAQVEVEPHRETLPSGETKAAARVDCFSCGGAGQIKDLGCHFCGGSGIQPRPWLRAGPDERTAKKEGDVGDWV